MIVDSRVFDGTDEGLDALIEWAGPARIPQVYWRMYPIPPVMVKCISVANPGSDMIQRAYPGDTIERHDDGLLVVMPAGIAERTVHIRPRDMI